MTLIYIHKYVINFTIIIITIITMLMKKFQFLSQEGEKYIHTKMIQAFWQAYMTYEDLFQLKDNKAFCKEKSSFSSLDSSIKQWSIGAHWPTIRPTGCSIHYITWIHPHLAIFFGSPFGFYPTFHTLASVGRKKAFQYA